MSNDIFSSVLHDGALFGFDLHEAQAKTHRTSRGIFRCIDFRSGQELWSVGTGRLQRDSINASGDAGILSDTEPRKQIIGHSTVLVADGKLVLMNDLGELILARASREKYEELCRTSLLGGEICWTQPAIAQKRLFVRNHSRAVCVYLGEQKTLAPQLKAKSIAVSQIPQSQFRDIASVLIGIEPEYLFDLPTLQWLWRWYWVSVIVVMGGSLAVVQIAATLAQLAKRSSFSNDANSKELRTKGTSYAFWVLTFVVGALGTTYFSRWTGEFVFTWQVCLYVAWHVAIANMSKRLTKRSFLQRLQSGGAAVFLLIACIAYFMLCRRLSLVFEWVFLCGFIAALPFNVADKHWFTHKKSCTIAWRCFMTVLGFSAYYWASVSILYWRSQM